MGQRLDSLDVLAKAASIRRDERLRDEAIAAMALPDVRRGPSWQALPPVSEAVPLAFDGNYRTYARANPDEGIISIRGFPDDHEIRRIDSGPNVNSLLLLSPDGRYVSTLHGLFANWRAMGYALKIWRVDDWQPILAGELRQIDNRAFSSDSRQLVVGRQGWILRFDLATG